MVLRGGEGNDIIYAGGHSSDVSSYYSSIEHGSEDGDSDGAIYMYGDEGHDKIYGGDAIRNQYMFGGEGDDFIRGGDTQIGFESDVHSL